MKFEIINHGSLVGFIPACETAQQWWDEHVQWCPMMGDQYLVEARYAGPILEGIKATSDKQQATPSQGGGKVKR